MCVGPGFWQPVESLTHVAAACRWAFAPVHPAARRIVHTAEWPGTRSVCSRTAQLLLGCETLHPAYGTMVSRRPWMARNGRVLLGAQVGTVSVPLTATNAL